MIVVNKHEGIIIPVLQHLGRRFNEIARNTGKNLNKAIEKDRTKNQPCSMESRILGFAQQTMENMAHLMEESHHIVVSHQSRFLRSGFR